MREKCKKNVVIVLFLGMKYRGKKLRCKEEEGCQSDDLHPKSAGALAFCAPSGHWRPM